MIPPTSIDRSVFTRHFARHYAEMVVVMFVGMGALALPARWMTDAAFPDVASDDPTLMLGRMAVTMTVPMVPWMRWRGHGWQPSLEMAAAMIVPAVTVVVLAELDVLTGIGLLMTIEHVAMFAAMFIAMAARPDEYSGHGHARGGERQLA
jgi:hypothetical protein